MKIDLKNVQYYYLNHNNFNRKTHMEQEFEDYSLTQVKSLNNVDPIKSIAYGHYNMINTAIETNIHQKMFRPIVFLEDDVKKQNYPSTLEIPDDTDIFYMGLSIWGIVDRNEGVPNTVCYTEINKDIIKVYNMLSAHGLIICSLRGLLLYQRCTMEGIMKNEHWDIFLAQSQPLYNIYALREPIVYQCKELGGKEGCTRVNYHGEIQYPSHWMKKNVSNIFK